MTKPTKQYAMGIDIGGTNMRAVLFDGREALADFALATPKDDLEHFMIMLNALIEPLRERAKNDKAIIKGLGLGVAGMFSLRDKKIIEAPNLPLLLGVKLAELAEARSGLPVAIDNDANCFTRAEAKLGAGRRYSNVFGITLGTGIGGAWWLNGQIYSGAHGGAGEPGWLVMDYKEGIRVEEAYHKLLQSNPAVMADEAYRGDVLAEKTYEEFGHDLGITLANIVNLIDPEIIVLGGSVMASSDLFISKTKKAMRQYIQSDEARKIKLVKSKLGELAGAIGAAMLVA